MVKKGFLEAIIHQGKTSFFKLRWSENEPLVQGVNITGSESEPVTGSENEPTIKDSTIKDLSIKEMSASLRSAGLPSSSKAQPPSAASPDNQERAEEESLNASVERILTFYKKTFQNFYGSEPVISKADIKMVKQRLSEERPVDELESEICWFLESKLSEELGSSLKVCFCSHVFNIWLSQAREGYGY